MGDICDHNDLERFMRSGEGKARLDAIRNGLLGRRILGLKPNKKQFVKVSESNPNRKYRIENSKT